MAISARILQIGSKFAGSAADCEQAYEPMVEPIVTLSGLHSKTWSLKSAEREGGGVMMFSSITRVHLRAPEGVRLH